MKNKVSLFTVGIAILTLFIVSQTHAQIGSNWMVTGDFNDGECIYQGPAKAIEDYNDNILLQNPGPPIIPIGAKFAISMDLILVSGSPSNCPPWLVNVNNTMFTIPGEADAPSVFPCVVDPLGGFGSPFTIQCNLIQPLNPNPNCGNGTEFIEIENGQFTSDFRSASGTWRTSMFGIFNLPDFDGPEGDWTATRVGDAILFPWIVKSNDVTTVVSVVNTAQTEAEALGLPFHNNRIHVEYWAKKTTANDQEEMCEEANFEVTSSKDDMVTWDIAGHFNGGLPMFNDESNEVIFATDMTLAVENPRRGFLIVENDTEFLLDARTPVDGTMYGEATIIEHKTGAAWGYVAYNSIWGTPYFYNTGDQNGEVVGTARVDHEAAGCEVGASDIGELTQTTLLNPNDAITKLFVTPVALGSQKQGNINARVQLCRFPTINVPDNEADFGSHYTGDCTGGGIWNNEEGGFSFTVKKNVVCTTADNIVDFFGGAGTAAYSQWTASGKAGWAYITPDRGNIDSRDGTSAHVEADDVIIGKLEFGTGLSWDGSIDDTINTFVWLRDSTSYQAACAQPYPIIDIDPGPSSDNLPFYIFPFTADLRCREGGINNIHNEPYQDFEIRLIGSN